LEKRHEESLIMRKWTTTAGLLFWAAAAVYTDQAIGAKPGKPAKSAPEKSTATDVKILDETTDPFSSTDPTTAPSTQPASANNANGGSTGGAGSQLQMNSDGTFSLNIVGGADLVEQLRVIGFQAQKSILPSKDVHATLPALDLYNVTVNEALDALLHTNNFVWAEKGNFIYVYTAKEAAEMEKANRVTNTEVFHLYYTPVKDISDIIKPVLSTDAQVSFTAPAVSGIESGAKDVGGNSHANDDILVVSDYPENLDRVRNLIKEIDRRPQQILIEATILRAALNEDNQLGVDFNVVGGVDFANIVSTAAGQIVNAGTGTVSTGNGTVHSAGTGNSFSGPINGGLKVGVVTNNVSVFLSALEGVTDTTVLANPKVLALNKQKGEVIVGNKDGYLTTTVTESAQTQTVEFLDTGTRLIFRPFIGDDGYIRMEIHPEDSSGGLNNANLPRKTTTEVTSNVMIKDGRTIVIGGLFRESSVSAKSQIPVLGNLPLIGPAFRNTRDQTTREEVIILITPHIVKDDAVYSELSEDQMRQWERLRVGNRRGMMPWGRERMAQMWYEWAVKEMNKSHPNRKKALWYLDGATGLNPTFQEAWNMKQELSGREIAEANNGSLRDFVKKNILADRAPATMPSADMGFDEFNSDPSTQPSDLAMDEPTTQPQVALGEEPTTEPSTQPGLAEDEAATQPAIATSDDEMSMAPTTEPSAVAVIDEDNGASTQPAVATGATTQPSNVASNDGFQGIFGLMNRMLGLEPSKTQVKHGDENAKSAKTTVTELPTEEVAPSGSSTDNK
jgi:type IV pilus assembly protein PilQ